MAYQNVGTPRFYINVLEWLHTLGFKQYDSVFHTLPTAKLPFDTYTEQTGFPSGLLSDKSFQMILGHTLNTDETTIAFQSFNSPFDNYGDFVNSSYDGSDMPTYNGWSLVTCECGDTDNFRIHVTDDTSLCSMIIGTYYDMPHSPDLNLSMSREYGGTKTIETKGGASLSNTMWSKPALWGDAGACELYQGTPTNHKLSRSSRRTWSLSFSYLDKGDVFGSNQSLTKYSTDIQSWADSSLYDTGDLNSVGGSLQGFNYNILTDDNFFSQIIHKTNGGQLPFIFQPDNSNFHPDNFAICKLDMNNFKFDQVANGVYNCKIRVREVW